MILCWWGWWIWADKWLRDFGGRWEKRAILYHFDIKKILKPGHERLLSFSEKRNYGGLHPFVAIRL
jgi:hypothetical protein